MEQVRIKSGGSSYSLCVYMPMCTLDSMLVKNKAKLKFIGVILGEPSKDP